MIVDRSVFPTLLLASMLASCGQTGPLYLPGDPSEVQSEVPDIALPAPQDEDEADDDEDDDNDEVGKEQS
jgi:predicted small lipoprotein YifL